ncbi:MAG TPA: cation:dicarboxylase symporter family transporter [Coleofasciculaceae cyanobacterium]
MGIAMPQFKKPSLVVQVVVGMILGIAIGHLFPQLGQDIQPLAKIFLNMIKMLIAPLLFATLVIGIAGAGSHHTVGRMGLKTIIYFEVATTIALIIGLTVANVLRPGAGMSLDLGAGNADQLAQIQTNAQTVAHHSFWDTLVHMFPTSVIKAMAEGDVLQLVVFSVFFALALGAAGEKGKPVMHVLESLSEVMFKFVGYVMAFAPMGVMAAMAATVGRNGLDVLFIYAKLVGSLYFALGLFVLTVLVTVCSCFKIPFGKLLQAIKEPFILAFSTASSESALPKAMEAMERFGVPKGVVSFVMPTGYTFNLDGSTLYLSLATLFVAQMVGVELSIQQQIIMLLTLMLTSKGVAAVPRASLVILAGTLTAFNLPVEGVAVILGIDHVLDMGRTSVNLLGNCVASAVVARWEGVLDDERMAAFGTEDEMALEDELEGLSPELA